MTERSQWESWKFDGGEILQKVKAIIQEGNVRRVLVKQQGRVVAEFPLTAGVVGVVLAPVLAALGALVALLKDCTIEIEREADADAREGARTDHPVAS